MGTFTHFNFVDLWLSGHMEKIKCVLMLSISLSLYIYIYIYPKNTRHMWPGLFLISSTLFKRFLVFLFYFFYFIFTLYVNENLQLTTRLQCHGKLTGIQTQEWPTTKNTKPVLETHQPFMQAWLKTLTTSFVF